MFVIKWHKCGFVKVLLLLLLLSSSSSSNSRSWIYSINLLASQYSFDSSLVVVSSFGHFSRCSLSIVVFFCLHIVQYLWLKIFMRWRWAARQSWTVLSQKLATAYLLGLFLLFGFVKLYFLTYGHGSDQLRVLRSMQKFDRGFCNCGRGSGFKRENSLSSNA